MTALAPKALVTWLADAATGWSMRRPFRPPLKALMLVPWYGRQVFLATPLLAALSASFPRARFDWAVSERAQTAIISNPRLTELIPAGERRLQWRERRALATLINRLRAQKYDTCYLPVPSRLLSYIAWRAGIPQRIGLAVAGSSFAHTLSVRPAASEDHVARRGLALARASGVSVETLDSVGSEFFPPDDARKAIMQVLVEQVDWLGGVPLAVIYPGSDTEGPTKADQWPAERFALLANHLVRQHGCRVIVAGSTAQLAQARTVAGLAAVPVANLATRLSLAEFGALCEVADLFVGHDVTPAHVAAAVGCPTLIIYGRRPAELASPYAVTSPVASLRPAAAGPSANGSSVTTAEAIREVDRLL